MVLRTSLEVFGDLTNYISSVQKAIENESQKVISTADKLKGKGYSEEQIADILDEDAYYSNTFAKNAYSMAVVLVYSQIESLLNTGMLAIGKIWKKHIKFNSLLNQYSKCGIELKQIDYFAVVNEIRLVNNVIKHNNLKCNVELSANNSFGWKAGDRIEVTEKTVCFYVDEAEKYFKELQIQINSVIDKQITEEEV